MKIFSENFFIHAQKCEGFLKEILQTECGFNVRRSRFEYRSYTYPIHIVFFEGTQKLGYFDPHTYQIGLHSDLIYSTKDEVLKNILRHELAHYLQFIASGSVALPHGEEFLNICRQYKWGEAVEKASLDIQLANDKLEGNLELEKMMKKVKALLSLAASDNEHEAQLATIKANELILKYNLKHFESGNKNIYSHTLLVAKRKNAKLTCIYDILKHFMVKPILIYGKRQVALEVSGTKDSIELAEYVAHFLDEELEKLFKARADLKGTRAKNSFFYGIAKGYEEKVIGIQDSLNKDQKMALVRAQTHLNSQLHLIYRRVAQTTSSARTDEAAYSSGKKAGKNLTIQSVLKKSNSKSKFLPWGRS
ncbi:MAG: hypothetical protein CME62_15190 [Halobacteriovoraceae bacterium]|nr:hypothetical protein [Halobacteriovoraceae bacterium]|tara:strand:+ start:13044 stop:14132 length:1089 start_codon:yes stop_codon:yes gene_type:complete